MKLVLFDFFCFITQNSRCLCLCCSESDSSHLLQDGFSVLCNERKDKITPASRFQLLFCSVSNMWANMLNLSGLTNCSSVKTCRNVYGSLSTDRRNALASQLKGILHRGIYKETGYFFRPNTDWSYDQTKDLISSAAKKYSLMCDHIKQTTFQVSSTESEAVNQQIFSTFLFT